MKLLVLTLCLATAVLASSPDLNREWQLWKGRNQKLYDAEDEEYRRFVWEYNFKVVNEHNSRYALGHTSYTMAMNKYADMTSVEFRRQMNGFVMKTTAPNKASNASVDITDLPQTVDWRPKGYVTPVKNQEQCGSCWAFSATGSLEGQTFKKTGKLPSISEQNLVDCAKGKYNCDGCEGGFMDGAFEYIQDNKGIDSEASYPYEAVDGECRFNRANVVAMDSSHVDVPSMDEKALQKDVAKIGPISVAIDASHESFQLYHNGVYDEPQCSQTELDHGVLAVGYGTEDSQDYWLVKNSWGANWGMKGYIMMSRNHDNQCGIATQASYPIV